MIKYFFSVITVLQLACQGAFAAHIVSPQAHIDINTKKVIHITGFIDEASVREAIREGNKTVELPGPRIVIINSGGGSVEWGQRLLNALIREKNSTGNKLICIVDHNASSMAFNILSNCDIRLSTWQATMLVHKVAVGTMCTEAQDRCTVKFLREVADDMERTDEPYRRQNAAAMHMTLAEYDNLAEMETFVTVESLLIRGYLNGIGTIN